MPKIQNGTVTRFHPNGVTILSKKSFNKDDQPHGLHVYNTKNGSRFITQFYLNGDLIFSDRGVPAGMTLGKDVENGLYGDKADLLPLIGQVSTGEVSAKKFEENLNTARLRTETANEEDWADLLGTEQVVKSNVFKM